jgi:hypothetical protein
MSSVEFCTGECEDRTRVLETEESPLLETVARGRLVKTQQAGKGLADAVMICELWRSVVTQNSSRKAINLVENQWHLNSIWWIELAGVLTLIKGFSIFRWMLGACYKIFSKYFFLIPFEITVF